MSGMTGRGRSSHRARVRETRRACLLAAAWLVMSGGIALAGVAVELEAGAVTFSRNDTRIPGNTGTRFNMLDLTGTGMSPYFRLYATYDFNERHALRLTFAPLTVSGTGVFEEEVSFDGVAFAADTDTKGSYTFNTYRLTYRWLWHTSERWRSGVGMAVLIRDAQISLEQGGQRASTYDLGLVPLLHFYAAYLLNDNTSAILDMEGAWAPQGRAVDMALKVQRDFESGWHLSTGYRTLEGGADNDSTYTFAWLHYAFLQAGYTF